MKRILSLVISSVILSLSLLSPFAHAAPTTEEVKWSITSKLKSYSQSLENSYRGQYGLLYNLYYITYSMHWTEAIYKLDDIGFSAPEKLVYSDSLSANIEAFNSKFGVSSDNSFIPFTIPVNSSSIKQTMENFIADKAPVYLRKILDDQTAKLATAKNTSDEEYDRVLEDNKQIIRMTYNVLDLLANGKADIKSLVTDVASSDQISTLSQSVSAAYLLSGADYKKIIETGRSLTESEVGDNAKVEYESSSTYIQQLAYVTAKSQPADGVYGAELYDPQDGKTGFKLRSSYVSMIAATSVYRPLVSHVGDKEYLSALEGIAGKEVYPQLQNLFNNIKDYKKPLYVIKDVGWFAEVFKGASKDEASFATYSGEGEPLSIKSFFDLIDKEDTSGFVTVRGDFTRSPDDTNVWGFYRKSAGLLNGTQSSSNPTTTTGTNTAAVPSATVAPNTTTTATPAPTGVPVTNVVTQGLVDTGSGTMIAVAGKSINTTEWTPSLFEFGYSDGLPIAGLSLVKNFLLSQRGRDDIKDQGTRMLFLNAFGDIVTDDNLVVIPAAANPMIYDRAKGYNPYTVAFMNGYPGVYVTGKNTLRVSNKDDIGKFLLMSSGDDKDAKQVFIKIQGESNLAVKHAKQPVSIYNDFVNAGTGTTKIFNRTNATVPGFMDSRLAMFSIGDASFSSDKMRAYAIEQSSVVGATTSTPIFPYDPSTDTTGEVAKLIAYNMYWSYANSANQSIDGFNGRLREDFIFRNILVEGLQGSPYSTTFTKNIVESYENLVDDGYSRSARWLKDFSKDVVSNLGYIDGVLGIKNRYEDPILGKVMTFLDEYYLYLYVVLIILFIIKYMHQRMSLGHTLLSTSLALIVSFSFINIIPVYLPDIYNVIVNNTGRDLSYNILATKAEKYGDTYGKSGKLDANGNFSISTTSVNLFKLTTADYPVVSGRMGIDKEYLHSNNAYIIDDQNGLYLQGGVLKLNVDTLLANNPITGSFSKSTGSLLYQYDSQKVYSSSIDYYMPYYSITDGFVSTLNQLLKVYSIPRHSVTYTDGISKDSFIMYSYVNSAPFLAPNNFQEYSDDITDEEARRLEANFSTPVDFLNLHAMLSKPSAEMQSSLWYQTMKTNGFFENTEEGNQRYIDLIGNVNRLTKKFMIELKGQVGLVSDENLIKMVSLYATTIFNQQIGDMWNKVYPTTLNYQEYSLEDTLLSAFISDYGKFISSNLDVSDYIASQSGPFLQALFIVNVVLAFLNAFLIQYLTPVLYLALGAILLIRYVSGAAMRGTVMGYLKVSTLVFISFSLYVSTLSWVMSWNLTAGLWTMFIVYAVILFILFQVFSSVVFNLTELGNSKLTTKFDKILDKIPGIDKVPFLNVGTTNIRHRQVEVNSATKAEFSAYSNDTSMSELDERSNYFTRALRRRKSDPRVYDMTLEEDNQVRSEVNKSTGAKSYNYGNMDHKDYSN